MACRPPCAQIMPCSWIFWTLRTLPPSPWGTPCHPEGTMKRGTLGIVKVFRHYPHRLLGGVARSDDVE